MMFLRSLCFLSSLFKNQYKIPSGEDLLKNENKIERRGQAHLLLAGGMGGEGGPDDRCTPTEAEGPSVLRDRGGG